VHPRGGHQALDSMGLLGFYVWRLGVGLGMPRLR
jgi:hypothetical protein